MKEFTIEEAKAILEAWLKKLSEEVVEYIKVADAEGEEGAKTRKISVFLTQGRIRHYDVGQRPDEVSQL